MKRHIGRNALSGAAAGLLAAGAMGVVAIWGAVFASANWYAPFELIGGLVTGTTARFDEGLQLGTAIVGVIVHLVTGACWGIFYGVLLGSRADDMTSKEGVSIGTLFGVLVWVIDLSVLVPLADPVVAVAIPLWFGAVLHVGYGAALGAAWPSLRGKLGLGESAASRRALQRGRALVGSGLTSTSTGDVSIRKAEQPRSVARY